MSVFGEGLKREVVLQRGWVDDDGKAYKRVVLRPPTIEDEIRRDMELERMRRSNSEAERLAAESETLNVLALVAQTIVEWEGIVQVQVMHIRQLSRNDAHKLMRAFHALEEQDLAMNVDDDDDGAEGNDPGESTDSPK